MTKLEFKRWFDRCFVPEVTEYLESQGLPNKVILLLDNATGHPGDLSSADLNVEVMFLPPNTTSLIQPMDQGVIRSFKANYMKIFIVNVLESKENYEEAVKNFNMLHCVQNVVKAWSEVTEDTAANAWNKLLSYDEPEGEDDRSLAELDNLIKLQNEAGLTDFDV